MPRLQKLRLAALSAVCLVSFVLAGPAFAAGVYDRKSQKCVKQSGANLSDENLADNAYALAKAGRHQDALDVLDTVKDQNAPEVLNYRGYATRKLGRLDEGIGYYLMSGARSVVSTDFPR